MPNEPQKNKKETTTTPRPPVVAVMGHIDHGKTTLLDYIRKTKVTEKESGGITQHVSAYEVEVSVGKKITFLDTPGHEAFAGIRSRGAKIADIAVLVVSGEDGVKPQTLEALKFILAAKLPYIVAVTKIDKEGINIERVKQSLLEHEIYVEGYGGTIPCVPVSAVTGSGVNELLDMILLVAEVENISATADKPAEGFVLETTRSKEKGVTATLVVKDGTMERGGVLTAGTATSPIRTMENFLGKRIERAEAGTPVVISGWDILPESGAAFHSFPSKKEAEKYLASQVGKSASAKVPENEGRALLPLVIKADVAGTLEAIEYELKKLGNEKIVPKVIRAGTGTVNESDLKIAAGSEGARVLAFNVKTDTAAKNLAERDTVSVETFDIIYKLLERVAALLAELAPKTEVAEVRGTAKIIRVFSVVKDKQIVGGKVLEGAISSGETFKIMRRGAEVGSGKIRGLEQQKVKTSEVVKDREFGAQVESKMEIAAGDVLETFVMVTK